MKEPRRFPPWLKMLLILGVIVAFLFGGYYFVIWIFTPTQEDLVQLSATPYIIVTPSPTIAPTPTVRPTPTIKADALYELMYFYNNNNQNAKAWINIPGVGLDTIVMQFKNNYYFLDHDINLNPNEYGAVFMDSRSKIDFIIEAGNVVVYGYNNQGGQQFKRLTQYLKADYFHNNSLVIMDTFYGTYNFRVFSVHIEGNDEVYINPIDAKKMPDFIGDCTQKSIFESKNIPGDNDIILTFTTDIEHTEGSRLLVHAYLENE